MPDLEATYLAAASKGTAPAARSMSALNDWCVARGSANRFDAQALADFIATYAAGSAAYGTPGTFSIVVPYFASLTVTVYGAGGGGGGTTGGGSTGGYAAFGGVIGYGGAGGAPAPAGGTAATGGATGGDSNLAGAGAAGGLGAWDQTSDKGGTYDSFGANGGAGGRATKTFTPATLTPGSTITIVVGGGGAPGSGAGNMRAAAAGANGYIAISWS